jgi:hypothetical protein
MKEILIFIFIALFHQISDAQNCGEVSVFTGVVTDNGNGTSNYQFTVKVINKRVVMSITCPNNIFVGTACYPVGTYVFNLDNRPTCTGPVQLDWTGYTSNNCQAGTVCNSNTIILPVELTTFKSTLQENKIVLNWSTQSELNNEKFVVERSGDGRAFEDIGEVDGYGTTTEAQDYQFIIEKPTPGINYFRLKQVDFDGHYEYSPVTSVLVPNGQLVSVYPTLSKGNIEVSLPPETDTPITLSLFNLQGALLFLREYPAQPNLSADLTALHPGAYIVEVKTGREVTRHRVFRVE